MSIINCSTNSKSFKAMFSKTDVLLKKNKCVLLHSLPLLILSNCLLVVWSMDDTLTVSSLCFMASNIAVSSF